MELTEQEAIRKVLGGDPDAYRSLMERHFPAVLRMALRVTGSPEDAEEAAQDAFLRAYNNLSTFRSDASFGTWVYRIAMNCALNLVERRSRNLAWRTASSPHTLAAENLLAAQTHTPESQLLEMESLRERERLLGCLTPAERSAFVLRHFEDQPVAVIAEALGTNTNTARQTIFRAVTKLRAALAPTRPARAAAAVLTPARQGSHHETL